MAVFSVGNDVEVSGDVIQTVIKTLKIKFLKDKLLEKYGFTDVQKGKFYNAKNYLQLLSDVNKEMPASMRGIGKSIFSEAMWPAELNSVEKVLMAIDVAYHMNHKKSGTVMFNPATGAITEGIGHYRTTKLGENSFQIECDNPYPCEFDMGLFEGIGVSFGKTIFVVHDQGSCRMKGGAKCVYKVTVR